MAGPSDPVATARTSARAAPRRLACWLASPAATPLLVAVAAVTAVTGSPLTRSWPPRWRPASHRCSRRAERLGVRAACSRHRDSDNLTGCQGQPACAASTTGTGRQKGRPACPQHRPPQARGDSSHPPFAAPPPEISPVRMAAAPGRPCIRWSIVAERARLCLADGLDLPARRLSTLPSPESQPAALGKPSLGHLPAASSGISPGAKELPDDVVTGIR